MRCACDVCTDVETQMRSREDGRARFSHPVKRQMIVYGPLSLHCLDEADGDFHGVVKTSTIE